LAAGVMALGVSVFAQQAPAPAGRGGRGAGGAQGQAAPAGRGAAAPVTPIPLFFRETFSNGPQFMARPIVVTDVTSPDRELKLYGPGAPAKPDHESGIELDSGIDPVTGNLVTWVWTGMTEDNWAVTVRDKQNYVDLSGLGRIHWRVRMRGENELRPVVKLADGTMLVGEYKEPLSTQWREDEFFLGDVPRWRVLDPKAVIGATDASWKVSPDLTKVDEVGFTDLMRGAGHGTAGNSGIDFIEVYGKPVKR
jgi:hypothetical protein